MRPDFPENLRSQIKKSTEPCKTETVGIQRYPVFYLTPSELGDIWLEKKFFFQKVYTLGAIALITMLTRVVLMSGPVISLPETVASFLWVVRLQSSRHDFPYSRDAFTNL